MSITDVLMPQGNEMTGCLLKAKQGKATTMGNLSQDEIIFSLILDNLTGKQMASEQLFGEGTGEERAQDKLRNEENLSLENLPESILGKEMFYRNHYQGDVLQGISQSILKYLPEYLPEDSLQVDEASLREKLVTLSNLQTLSQEFPAGKEANSGSKDQSLNLFEQSVITASKEIVPADEKVQALRSIQQIGLEGKISPITEETLSLNSKELAQDIKIIEQLQKLSGTIKVVENKVELQPQVQPQIQPQIQPQMQQQIQTQIQPQMPSNKQDSQMVKNSNEIEEYAAFALDKAAEVVNQHDGEESVNKIKQPIEQGRVWEQVLDVLKKQELRNKEVQELSIRLQPAELGKLNISLRMENNQVHLVLQVTEQVTNDLLQNQLPELRNGLSQMGVNCGHFTMSQEGRENNSNWHSSSQNNNAGLDTQEEDSETLAKRQYYALAHGTGGKINYSA